MYLYKYKYPFNLRNTLLQIWINIFENLKKNTHFIFPDSSNLIRFSMWDFSHHKSPNPTRVVCNSGGIRNQVLRNPSRMKTIKNAFSHILYTIMLNTLLKVKDHENNARRIYLTTVLWGKVGSMREEFISHYICPYRQRAWSVKFQTCSDMLY